MLVRVAIGTLGCKANQADAEALVARLRAHAEVVQLGRAADLVVVNSCTVTATAARQSRQLVHRARRSHPDAIVVLTGCLPAVDPDGARRVAGVDHVLPLAEHDRIVALVRELARARGQGPGGGADLRPARRRPFLKLQDGCDGCCAYCIVPTARGRARTVLTPQQVAARLGELAVQGAQEVVLTGIHLGRYGVDLEPPLALDQLLERSVGIVPRLRLSSLEPLEVSPALLELLRRQPVGLCPHLHVPLQSGDDVVLRRMRRPYRPEQAQRLLARARRALPRAALGADLLVGFPGEDEAAFERTAELLRDAPLTHAHVFVFSPRAGTEAALLPDQVPPALARRRGQRLRELGQRKLERFAREQLGSWRPVLVEQRRRDGRLSGTSDNYLRVALQGPDALLGQIVPVELQRLDQEGLVSGALTGRG